MLVHESANEVNLGPDRPLRPRWGFADGADDELRAAREVGLLHDFPLAFGMNQDFALRVESANLIALGLGEQPVHAAMAFPQDHLRVADRSATGLWPRACAWGSDRRAQTAVGELRVVDHHAIERYAHAIGRVATEVLIRQKHHLAALGEGPFQDFAGIAARATGPAVSAAEGLD